MAQPLHSTILDELKRQLLAAKRLTSTGSEVALLQPDSIVTDQAYQADMLIATEGHPVALIMQEDFFDLQKAPRRTQRFELDDERFVIVTSRQRQVHRYTITVQIVAEDPGWGVYIQQLLEALADTDGFGWKAADILDDEDELLDTFVARVRQEVEPPRREQVIEEVPLEDGDEDMRIPAVRAVNWIIPISCTAYVYRYRLTQAAGLRVVTVNRE
jgi:hypothetical protein